MDFGPILAFVSKTDLLFQYSGNIKKFITDSNAVAQEKGLEATLAYVENCDAAGRVTSDAIEGIVAKCVAAPKAKTKDLAKQIALMYCEIEHYEKAIEELLKGLTQKNPKVVSGCIHIMTECLHAFGAKVIKVSPLLKAIVPLLDHRDKAVREEGKFLVILGPFLTQFLFYRKRPDRRSVSMGRRYHETTTIRGQTRANVRTRDRI